MYRIALFFSIIIYSISFSSCTSDEKQTSTSDDTPLFTMIPASESGISFNNMITEDLTYNTLTNEYILQGGGVGILDVNNDGLQDILFAGNMVDDKLFLNKGDFQFEDITPTSGIKSDKSWTSGVSVVDINNDGYQDLYLSKYVRNEKELRTNLLYINNGDNTFSEQGKAYGLDDDGHSIMANFFDYDMDGDLDCYVANQPPSAKTEREKWKPTDIQNTDRLYRNEGNNKFVEVSKEAGIQNNHYTLSVTVNDLDNDGYPDIYLASDYEEPDIYYSNNGDGTFTNIADQAMQHMSNFAMGADVADINNDGYKDLFTADMVAADNFRNKTNMASMNPEKFWNMVNIGYHYQYMFNALQLNNGNGTFSEVAQLAGVSKTDWSWAPLFIDADHDGHRDLFVTNGIFKEIRNKDYRKDLEKLVAKKKKENNGKNVALNPIELSDMAPSIKVPNKVFQNNGDMTFSLKSEEWGMDTPNWSQGMAYADFDNDGDLDIVMNHTNENATLYRNNNTQGNYLIIDFTEMKGLGHNADVKVTTSSGNYIHETTPYRGYLSSVQNIAHFGLGDANKVRKIEVEYSDGSKWTTTNVDANKVIKAEKGNEKVATTTTKTTLFQKGNEAGVVHLENKFDDYQREILLPYKLSHLGPCLATGDVNGDGDGFIDFYIGGSAGLRGQFFTQGPNSSFDFVNHPALDADAIHEDGAAVFFDADGDGDQDMYIASGGTEWEVGSANYIDRLYINEGGQFKKSNTIPKITASVHTVLPFDYDGDGDMDLFLGTRHIPGRYGVPATSFLLENDGKGTFSNATEKKAQDLENIGMVTAAHTSDIDGDGKEELIIAGEWMAIKTFSYDKEGLREMKNASLEDYTGLWNTIEIADLDNDGDMDILAGNYSPNYKYAVSPENPYQMYVDDFDDNGTNDIYLGYKDEADGKTYPVRGKQCSSEQMPFVSEKYETYNEFGIASVDEILEGKTAEAIRLSVNTLDNMYFRNNGKGSFEAVSLPVWAQVSSIMDFAVEDVNNDGLQDVIAVGNYHQREVETTRSDAGVGSILLMGKDGNLTAVHPSETGIVANLDARKITMLNNKLAIILNNSGPIQLYNRTGM